MSLLMIYLIMFLLIMCIYLMRSLFMIYLIRSLLRVDIVFTVLFIRSVDVSLTLEAGLCLVKYESTVVRSCIRLTVRGS